MMPGSGAAAQGQVVHRFAVAPMLDLTDRYARYFLRLLSRRALLYTEMITTGALLHQDPQPFLEHDPLEQPLAVQFGGADPEALARCAALAAAAGYPEINLNLGCPSDRVQSGRFGACLMAEPGLVAEAVAAMREAAPDRVISVKTRLGIDHQDSYAFLTTLVERVAAAGCRTWIIHARKAWLKGLSPKENREVPPLDYTRVWRLKADFPQLEIRLNGGLTSLTDCLAQLPGVDGVMLGRAAYDNPWLLTEVDQRLYGDPPRPRERWQVLEALLPLVERMEAAGLPLHRLTRHLMGLYRDQPGARAWRRALSEQAQVPGAGRAVFLAILERYGGRCGA